MWVVLVATAAVPELELGAMAEALASDFNGGAVEDGAVAVEIA